MKDRIEKIMEREQLSASKFADLIGVQRSSISHILSGRNKPSLELVNKILDHFDQINADWLLLGKGEMMTTDETANETYQFAESNKVVRHNPKSKDQQAAGSRTLTQIVFFYSDNTFEIYHQSS